MRLNISKEQYSPVKEVTKSFRQKLARSFLAAITLAATLPTIGFANSKPDIIEISCVRLPEKRQDSKEGTYLPQKLGERLKRFKIVYVYGTPHAQERAFNDGIIERLGAPTDSIVYFGEKQYFRVTGSEQNCVATPDTPNEITRPHMLDIPGGLAP